MPEINNQTEYFGIPIEEYPAPCRSCPLLARRALHGAGIDFNERAPLLGRMNKADIIAHALFPRLDGCSDEACGLDTHALQAKNDLE